MAYLMFLEDFKVDRKVVMEYNYVLSVGHSLRAYFMLNKHWWKFVLGHF